MANAPRLPTISVFYGPPASGKTYAAARLDSVFVRDYKDVTKELLQSSHIIALDSLALNDASLNLAFFRINSHFESPQTRAPTDIIVILQEDPRARAEALEKETRPISGSGIASYTTKWLMHNTTNYVEFPVASTIVLNRRGSTLSDSSDPLWTIEVDA